jgi:predicted kinase
MKKPLVVLVNGLPGTGKTTLAKRLAKDTKLPVFHRDGIYETLYDALDCQTHGRPPLLAPAAFVLLHYIAGSLLAAGQSLILEGFFGLTELGTAEFLQLQQMHDFEPLQIQCKADGSLLLQRFLARAGSEERHSCHQDMEFVERSKERMLQGRLAPLALEGQIIEIDTTTFHSFDYADVLQRVNLALLNTLNA